MRAVIFDFDGTIADSLAAVIHVFERLTDRREPFTSAEIKAMQHKDLLQIALDLGIPKWKIPWLLYRGRRMFRHHMKDVKIHPGMAEFITSLHKQKTQMFVLSSNSRENVELYLRWHGLEQYFIGIYGGASLFGKARSLHRLLKKYDIDPSESWYVGDERRDVAGSHAVGLKIVAVTWGYNSRHALREAKPDVLVDTPEELGKTFAKLWKS